MKIINEAFDLLTYFVYSAGIVTSIAEVIDGLSEIKEETFFALGCCLIFFLARWILKTLKI